jgi:hypothetical protein
MMTKERKRCRRVRESLCEADARELRDAAEHLAGCAACSAFARRLDLARRELALPLSSAEPDPLFPARVVARIERPAELIGWAAFRALPAALGLALVLAGTAGWLGLAGGAGSSGAPPPPTPPGAAVLDGPPSSDQLLAWASQSPEVWP